MKKILVIAFLSAALAVTGCDAFRWLAGRPVSSEIEARRVELRKIREDEHRARMDSLRKVEKSLADSLAILDSLKNMSGTMLNPSAMGGLYESALGYRYYIVIGAFMDKGNAGYLAGKAGEAGYEVSVIHFRNGFNAVGICPSDNLNQAFESLKKVKTEDFCPEDVWILVNE